jgi:hypothetical protein
MICATIMLPPRWTPGAVCVDVEMRCSACRRRLRRPKRTREQRSATEPHFGGAHKRQNSEISSFQMTSSLCMSPSLKLSHWNMTDDDARTWHHEYIIGSNRMPDPIYGRRGCVAVSRGTALGSPPLNCPVLRPLCHSRLSATVARGGGAETAAPAPGPWWPPSGRVLCHSPASCHDPGRAAGSVWRGPASAAVTASGVRPGGPGPRRHGPGPVTVSAWDSKFPPPQSSPGQQQRLIMISSCPAMIACRNSWAVCAIIHD